MKTKITRKVIESFPVPEHGKINLCYDNELTGFAFRVSPKGKRVFFVERIRKGKKFQRTIGKYGDPWTVAQARKKATELLLEADTGTSITPKQTSEHQYAHITFGETIQTYLEDNNRLKQSTKHEYLETLRRDADDWFERPLISIASDSSGFMRRFQKIYTRSQSSADRFFRYSHIIFAFAIKRYVDSSGIPLFYTNPADVVTNSHARPKAKRKETYITEDMLPHWGKAVLSLKNNRDKYDSTLHIRNCILLMFFTGLRLNEALSITWAGINLEKKEFTVFNTKNRGSHTLPMTSFTQSIFVAQDVKRASAVKEIELWNETHKNKRIASAINNLEHEIIFDWFDSNQNNLKDSAHLIQSAGLMKYVFPSGRLLGHVSNPSKTIHQVNELTGIEAGVLKKDDFEFRAKELSSSERNAKSQLIRDKLRSSKCFFTAHDLRRTISINLLRMGYSEYVIKAILNHKEMKSDGVSNDVTIGYIKGGLSPDALLKALESVNTYLASKAGIKLGDI